ncbi:MAG: hypothetical protein JHD25_00690 [Sphingomonadaceae bacterium]|jgi:hypothetical protein|nr:hypothetical protein [Sphingomonadaceae bacterium]
MWLGKQEGPTKADKGNGASLDAIKANADTCANHLAPIVDRLRSEGITSLPQITKKFFMFVLYKMISIFQDTL